MTSPDPGQSPGTEPKRKTGNGTIRRYTFRTEMDTDEKAALNMLSAACINHWWYTEAAATGHPLVFTFVTVGRDQWWCHRRAIDLAINVVYASGGKDADVPAPTWEKLPPHGNRGHLIDRAEADR
jgi:hypothetical protein